MHLSPAVWSAFSWREYARWCGQYASRRVDDGRAINSVVKLVSSFCRVEGGLPCYRHDVCVLRLPPGFPAVPQYLSPTSVVPQSRVAGRDYSRQAPSERHVQVSLHAAQALRTPCCGRGFTTSNRWLWTWAWQSYPHPRSVSLG